MMRNQLLLLLILWTPLTALAQQVGETPTTGRKFTQPQVMSEGDIRRIDKDAKKITLRHGPIANLDMPAMTMVYQVKDLTLLDKINVGDKVLFYAEKVDGVYILMSIESVR